MKDSDLVMILAPDEFQSDLYIKKIEQNLRKGAILAFAHGFNIHFKKIKPSSDVSIIMIAPKGPGHTVRSTYLSGGGVPSLIAVYKDAITEAKNARQKALEAYLHAKNIKATYLLDLESESDSDIESELNFN